MTDATTELTADAARALATRLFNRTWELLESGGPAPGREALVTAMASRLHWDGVGSTESLAAGHWLVAHVASRAGYADLALDFAAAAHERVVSAGDAAPAWLLASTQEGLARAHAAAGQDEERDRWAEEARRTLAAVDDDEDREVVESQLATVPGLGDR
jgi:hypothetical protein